jgi:hypothetical protein
MHRSSKALTKTKQRKLQSKQEAWVGATVNSGTDGCSSETSHTCEFMQEQSVRASQLKVFTLAFAPFGVGWNRFLGAIESNLHHNLAEEKSWVQIKGR